MFIPVVLKGGAEELVSKDELQFLIINQQVLFFKRSDGWVIIGHDRMRGPKASVLGKFRLNQSRQTAD